uniref:Uncharacterized protein n=1 Tax=Avena sativa TaxID=4498 RepID=A0ACD5TQ78_AVESA
MAVSINILLVLRRWRDRWNKPPTLLQIQQVTRCIQIAVLCKAKNPEQRPSITKIIEFLSKPESKDEHISLISPCLDEDDMLKIEPLEIRLTSELKDTISCSVELTNSTCTCIAFNIQLPSARYSAQPAQGIVHPQSMYVVTITVQARDVLEHDHADKFIVQSTKCREGLRNEDIRESMFHEEAGKVVDEVSLMVVYETASRQIELGSLHPKREIISRHYSFNMRYIDNERYRAVDVARGAMGSLLDKLGKLVTEDYNLEKSMKEDIESFSQQLVKMHLDLLNLENIDEARIWVEEVRDLSYHIEDMVDGFLAHVLENGNNQIGDVITDIKRKVQAMAKKGKGYNSDIENAVANTYFWTSAIHKDKEQLIGIEAPIDELIKLFEEDDDVPKQSLKILSIFGMGGLGKSALAKAVYDKLQTKYRPRAFITVGPNADVKILLKNILTECGKGAAILEHLDVPQLSNQLKDFLKDKRHRLGASLLWSIIVS